MLLCFCLHRCCGTVGSTRIFIKMFDKIVLLSGTRIGLSDGVVTSFVMWQTDSLRVDSATVDGDPGDLKGDWKQQSGTVALNVDAEVGALTEIFSSFQLNNPVARQEARTVTLSVVQDTGKTLVTIVPPFTMTGSVFSSSPTGKVLTFEARESTQVRSSSNTISVSFTLSYPLSHGAKVTISGLTGADTPTNPALRLTGPDGQVFGEEASWTASSGTLLLSVTRLVLRPAGYKVC